MSTPRCSRFWSHASLLTLLGSVGFASLAHAQSSGSLAVEEELTEVTVSASRIKTLGTVVEQTATKTRVAIGQEYLQTQQAGQSVIQSLNQVPGVNFTNNDAYGNTGGNLRIRGFEGSRVAATFDGMPINDSGNYALYTNQLLDPELIERVDVNLGTTDVDSPTASATGGTVAFRSLTPNKEAGGVAVLTGGSENYKRGFVRADSGEFGPFGTRGWVAASYTKYDKFKGPGELEKKQFNAKLYQDLSDSGNWVSLAAHWNINRNAQTRSTSKANFLLYGRDYDNTATCFRQTPTRGTAQDDNATLIANTPTLLAADNPANPTACVNYYDIRINPSDTGNIRAQSLFHLSEKLRLTIDPSFQYTLANGGGSSTQAEAVALTSNDRRVFGNSTLTGIDLNGDGDTLDTVRFFNPSNTNTKRWGLTSSLIYDISENHLIRLAYSLDYARHRQTGAYGYLEPDGTPENVFAGRRGTKVVSADGAYYLTSRDRYSIASLNQGAAEYRGEFLEKRLVLQAGVRAPFFKRNLNQYCYTPNGGSGGTGGVATGSNCTTQVPTPVPGGSGNVTFGTSVIQYIPPYATTIKFDDVLPNLGTTYKLTDTMTVYASYAENLSAARTDNLYPVRRLADNSIGRGIPDAEKTKAYDIGWRYSSTSILASAAFYWIDYDNRIVSAYDPDVQISTDRNLGKVKVNGFDLQAGYRPIEMLTLSGSASYNTSDVKENIPTASGVPILTKGKKLVETPDWTYALRADLSLGAHFRAGMQGKYVARRFSTDVNDEYANAYQVFDLDASYSFDLARFESLELQVNLSNLFDKQYFGSISSATGGPGGGTGFFNIGAPRTLSASVKVAF